MRRARLVGVGTAAALCFAWAWLGAPAAPAQTVRIPAEAVADVQEVRSILDQGHQLESQQRWADALSYYEEAVRKYPAAHDLESRLQLARQHYEVGRRYADSSFLTLVSGIGAQNAIDLYGEVLLKVHAHFVHDADWNAIVHSGITATEVALSESVFRQRHHLTVDEATIAAAIADLRALAGQHQHQSRHDARNAGWTMAQRLQQRLQLPAEATVLEFTAAAVSSLDDYSALLTGNQLDELLSQIEGNFVGLGLELKPAQTTLAIVDVIPGGPAAEAGLAAGEHIDEVDGQRTAEISADVAADLLKGPDGTYVTLVVSNTAGQQRRVRVQRRVVDLPSVQNVSLLDANYGIGYLRITSFQKTTTHDMDSALWQLHRQGMRSLIIDLRGNPGGLLTASVEVADRFIAEGGIVSTRGRSPGEDFDYKAHAPGTWRVPLVVLIDGDSASASEIFAGAIRDNRRGLIVGVRSYGKGSVQGIFPLNTAKIGVRLTTAKFYSPSGQPISRRGVEPDVPVDSSRRVTARPALENGGQPDALNDAILTTGLDVARRQSR